jgi:putative membrane protein
MGRYLRVLVAAFALAWIWAAICPKFPEDWLLENYLIFIFVPAIIFSGWYLKLSNLSYTLITVFMILHLIGAHYTYSEVPFGFTLQRWLSADRNMYDRMVHFSFGFLMAYPVRELFMRVARAKGFWGYYFPFELMLAFSAAYEIIEWVVASRSDAKSGLAFLGTQGDIWDAQKDMLCAGVGAILAMLVVALMNWLYDRNFGREIKGSLTVTPGDKPRGEVLLKKWFGCR